MGEEESARERLANARLEKAFGFSSFLFSAQPQPPPSLSLLLSLFLLFLQEKPSAARSSTPRSASCAPSRAPPRPCASGGFRPRPPPPSSRRGGGGGRAPRAMEAKTKTARMKTKTTTTTTTTAATLASSSAASPRPAATPTPSPSRPSSTTRRSTFCRSSRSKRRSSPFEATSSGGSAASAVSGT